MNRHGASTLVVVVILLTIILLVQVFQQMFSGRVTDQAFRNVYGRIANDLAGTAVQEARALLEKRVNDPSRPEFAKARENNAGPSVKLDLPVPVSELTETARLIASEEKGGFKIVSCVANLVPLNRLGRGTPIEYEGVLTVSASVQSAADSGILRKVTRTWALKLVHIAPPGPLQQFTALIRNPVNVFRGRYDAPDIARRFMEENLPGLIAELQKTLADIDRQMQGADSQMKDALTRLRAMYSPLVEGADGGRVGAVLKPLQPRWTALPPLPTEFSLVNKDPQLNVGEFDLQGDFEEMIPNYRQQSQALEALGQQVRATKTMDAAAQALHQRYVDNTAQIAALMGKVADRYIRFREKFSLVAKSDAAYDLLEKAYGCVDPVKPMANFAFPAFDPRICFINDETLAQVSANEALQRLMARLERDEDGVQGVMSIQNPSSPLTLSGQLKGRWTLVVTGSLTIDNLRRADPSKDLFTIVHFVSDTGTLAMSGTVDATVISSGRRLSVANGTQITGGLFLHDVDPGVRIEPALDGPEQVKLDPARSAGDGERRRHALISPWTRSAIVDRN